MAMTDYGALLRVNGKFVNKNNGSLFMNSSDTGYVCKKAARSDGYEFDVAGNYFVYAGDKDFLCVFYKGHIIAISNEKVVFDQYGTDFLGEEIYLKGFPTLKIEHLDKNYKYEKFEPFNKEWWIRELGKKKGQMRFNRELKKSVKTIYKELSYIFLATWEHNGNKYEVIYGYGVDPNEDTWNKIKYEWEFSDAEIEIIDRWFKS